MKWIVHFLFLFLVHCNSTNTSRTYSWKLEELYYHEDIRIIQASNTAKEYLSQTEHINSPIDVAYYRGSSSDSKDSFFRIILLNKQGNKYHLYSIILQYVSQLAYSGFTVLSINNTSTYKTLSINNIKLFRIHRQIDIFYKLNSKNIKYIIEVIEYSSFIENNIYIAKVKLMNNIITRVIVIEDGNEYIINGDIIE